MKYCPISNKMTFCTEHCKDCAREYHEELKNKIPKAEYVSEEFIKSNLGIAAFELMRAYGFIEYCATIQEKKMYAI